MSRFIKNDARADDKEMTILLAALIEKISEGGLGNVREHQRNLFVSLANELRKNTI